MRHAIIDNSTLTSVQRLLGDIQIQNKHSIDGDIAAFENFLQANLMYDNVSYINDYKEEYKSFRRKKFDFLRPIDIGEDDYNLIREEVVALHSEMVPKLEGGEFKDENFKEFFDILDMNLICTWDMSSSVFFLTTKMLDGVEGIGLEKYSKLSAAIYSELSSKYSSDNSQINDSIILVDSRGNEISNGYKVINRMGIEAETGISRQFKAFYSSLNWLSFRTLFYSIISRDTKGDVFLHPIRHSFNANILRRYTKQEEGIYRPIIDALHMSAEGTLKEVVGKDKPYIHSINFPLISSWLASKIDDPNYYLESLSDIKNSKEFIKLRETLDRLEAIKTVSGQGEFIKGTNLLLKDLERCMNDVMSNYAISTPQGIKTSNIITLWNCAPFHPKIPNVDINIPLPESLKNRISVNIAYKNIVNELANISELGVLHDKLTSRVSYKRDASFYDAKTEDYRYRRSKSYWKIPM